MSRNNRDVCPVTGKSIQSVPLQFNGEPASVTNMLRCVIYEAFTLACAVQAVRNCGWSDDLRYSHPTLGCFDPSEPLKRSVLLSFRLLFDFLYNPASGDDFQLQDFTSFGVLQTGFPIPIFDGFEDGVAFTKDSINKYIAHLTWTRINKTKSIPQPKFTRGTAAAVGNSLVLLQDFQRFLNTVMNHPSFPPLDESASGYRDMFLQATSRLAR